MLNTYSILEISASGVKLLVGYIFNQNVYILHALLSTSSHLNKGQITDKEEMILCIKEVVNSASKTLNMPIRDVVLLIPPLSLTLGSEQGSTNSIAKDGHLTNFDVSNALSIISKKVMTPDKTIVEIVPYNFSYDDGEPHRFFNHNVVSNSLSVEADVSLIDSALYDSFIQVVKGAGIEVSRTVLAPAGAITLLSYYNVAKQFMLIDFGQSLTSLSLASEGRLVRTEILNFGSEDLDLALMKRFKIDKEKAIYYKNVFGLSDEPPFPFTLGDGITVKDIRSCLEETLTPLIDFIRECVLEFKVPEFYPIMMSGGGANLFNLDRFISSVFQTKVIIYTPEYFGARNKSYTNLVAALRHIDLYPALISRRKGNDFHLTRVDSKIIDPVERDEDPEIL